MNATKVLMATSSGPNGWAAAEVFAHLYITSPTLAYMLPVALNVLNSALVLIAHTASDCVASGLTSTIRVYFIALAIAAELWAFILHFAYLAGYWDLIQNIY